MEVQIRTRSSDKESMHATGNVFTLRGRCAWRQIQGKLQAITGTGRHSRAAGLGCASIVHRPWGTNLAGQGAKAEGGANTLRQWHARRKALDHCSVRLAC